MTRKRQWGERKFKSINMQRLRFLKQSELIDGKHVQDILLAFRERQTLRDQEGRVGDENTKTLMVLCI